MNKKNRWFLLRGKVFLIIALFLGGVWSGTFLYRYSYQNVPRVATQGFISEYEATRDYDDIVKLFERNRYFLTADPHQSIGYMLKHRSPHENPLYWNSLNIDVFRKDNEFVGFTTYYKLTAHEGKILFLAIAENYRGQRYGEQLIQHAIEQLVKQGVQSIILATRVNNYAGQKLYKRLGFLEVSRNDGFIHYKYIP